MNYLTKLFVAPALLIACFSVSANGYIFVEDGRINNVKLQKVAEKYNIGYYKNPQCAPPAGACPLVLDGYQLKNGEFTFQTTLDTHEKVDLIFENITAAQDFETALRGTTASKGHLYEAAGEGLNRKTIVLKYVVGDSTDNNGTQIPERFHIEYYSIP